MARFTDRTFIVTGAAGGLGRACALRLASEGGSVVVSDLDVAGTAAVAAEITAAGGEALAAPADVTDAAAVRGLVEGAVQHYGALDGAVNNAGISPPPMPLGEYDEDLWDTVVNINLRGVFLCLKYELARMSEQGSGRVVNIASTAGVAVQIPGVAAYAASKHAVVGLTKAAARDYAAQGIRVNAVCPGHIRTPMSAPLLADNPETERAVVARIPMGRISDPEEIAGTVAYLLSDDSSFVTGTTLTADGGVTM
ncbi:SDR family NAD(P)-dependent oxidoreductase [Nocardia miyunensis]|uniref:SDR family NAD(P)-dependent oxidoreductase n=1 Tax=Nocardia miyunensis TaxID=282684 RepID=UPI0008328243|nr:glucose 1-dehydrogenase [Nocardia miyunensis]